MATLDSVLLTSWMNQCSFLCCMDTVMWLKSSSPYFIFLFLYLYNGSHLKSKVWKIAWIKDTGKMKTRQDLIVTRWFCWKLINSDKHLSPSPTVQPKQHLCFFNLCNITLDCPKGVSWITLLRSFYGDSRESKRRRMKWRREHTGRLQAEQLLTMIETYSQSIFKAFVPTQHLKHTWELWVCPVLCHRSVRQMVTLQQQLKKWLAS